MAEPAPVRRDADPALRGRLTAKPKRPPPREIQNTGLHRIHFDGRDAEFLAPNGYDPQVATPLLILLHGAGGQPDQVMTLVADHAERLGFLVLAPKSRGSSWDVIQGGFDVDVRFIDRALERIFGEFAVDPERIGIGGFSDGASYALSLGLLNGDLFSDVLAFSPGFAVTPDPVGRPRLFICHGERDQVLPIDRCARPLSREYSYAGYDMVYREFPDGHVVPPDMVDIAVRRFLGRDEEGRAI